MNESPTPNPETEMPLSMQWKYAMGRILLVLIPVVLLFIFVVLPRIHGSSKPRDLYVSVKGSDNNDGLTAANAYRTVQKSLSEAKPGDTVHIGDGLYREALHTIRNGRKDAPIRLTGTRDAVLSARTGNSRVFEVYHDYITLDGFRVDGLVGQGVSKDDYADKLIYAMGQKNSDGVRGLKLFNLLIENASGECVRLRYFARDNEIANSTIRNCGINDFRFNGGGKNGEGIYIGTAPEQRADGKNPNDKVDQSRNNWIHNNYIQTNGNECVDVKEGATGNIVEHNDCTGQSDPKSGGLDARGNNNIFRYNVIHDNAGAGVRLGGDSAGDGLGNQVYGNTITGNRSGGIRVQRLPQGKMCDNTISDNNEGDIVGEGTEDLHPTNSCANDI